MAAPISDLSDPLALVPAESDAVFRINGAALRRSSLWSKYQRRALTLFAPGFVGCDYDPFSDLESVTAGIVMEADDGLFVIRGVDRDRLLGCLRNSNAPSNTDVAFDGAFVTMTHRHGAVNMFTFVDRSTMVMEGSTRPTKESLSRALSMGAPLRANPAYVELERKIDPEAAISVIFTPGSALLAQVEQQLGVPIQDGYLVVQITDRVELTITMSTDTIEHATQLADAIAPQLEDTRRHVDKLNVAARGTSLVFNAAVTEVEIERIVKLIEPLMRDQGIDANKE
jgi:hypothetical protein